MKITEDSRLVNMEKTVCVLAGDVGGTKTHPGLFVAGNTGLKFFPAMTILVKWRQLQRLSMFPPYAG